MDSRTTIRYYYWLFLTALLPYASGLIPVLPQEVFGFNWGGYAWIIMLIVSLFRITRHLTSVSMPYFIWLPWILCISIQWFIDRSFFALQSTLQYMVFIIVGLAASTYEYTDETLLHIKKLFLIFTYIILGGVFVNILGMGRLLGGATTVMTVVVLSALVLSDYWVYRNKRALLLFALLIVFPIAAVTRMGILMVLAVAAFHFANRKAVSKLFIGIVIGISGLLIFYSDSFQHKTFFNGKGDINQVLSENDNLNTNGRSTLWSLTEEGMKTHPWFGMGARADLQLLIMNKYALRELHNDYVAIRYNYGWVGLSCLLFGFVMQFLMLYKRRNDLTDAYTALCFYAAITLFIAWAGFMYSDNALKYATYYGNLHFCLLGITYSRLKLMDSPQKDLYDQYSHTALQ